MRPRYGRRGLTSGQKRALQQYWPAYGTEVHTATPDWQSCFGRSAPLILDVGSGSGDSTIALARRYPECNLLAVELYLPGIGSLLLRIAAEKLSNIRIFRGDVVELLRNLLGSESLYLAWLLFPDPWPKRRHHKRRLLVPNVFRLLAQRLQMHGRAYIATDVDEYALWALRALQQDTGLLNLAGAGRFAPRPCQQPLTRHEQAAHRAGRRVWHLVLARNAHPTA